MQIHRPGSHCGGGRCLGSCYDGGRGGCVHAIWWSGGDGCCAVLWDGGGWSMRWYSGGLVGVVFVGKSFSVVRPVHFFSNPLSKTHFFIVKSLFGVHTVSTKPGAY